MPDVQECETCAEMGKRGVKANRQMQGVWVCVDCIVEMNTQELLAESTKKDVARNAAVISARPTTIQETAKSIAMPIPQPLTPSTVEAPQVRTLVTSLSKVLDGLVAGTIKPETAFAVCKVSAETVKAMELMWRMSRG